MASAPWQSGAEAIGLFTSVPSPHDLLHAVHIREARSEAEVCRSLLLKSRSGCPATSGGDAGRRGGRPCAGVRRTGTTASYEDMLATDRAGSTFAVSRWLSRTSATSAVRTVDPLGVPWAASTLPVTAVPPVQSRRSQSSVTPCSACPPGRSRASSTLHVSLSTTPTTPSTWRVIETAIAVSLLRST